MIQYGTAVLLLFIDLSSNKHKDLDESLVEEGEQDDGEDMAEIGEEEEQDDDPIEEFSEEEVGKKPAVAEIHLGCLMFRL